MPRNPSRDSTTGERKPLARGRNPSARPRRSTSIAAGSDKKGGFPMFRFTKMRPVSLIALALVVAAAWSMSLAVETTSRFQGPKANTGTATFVVEGGKRMLMLSDDFVVPDTPDPHWQVVDSMGMTHLLARIPIKGNKINRKVEVPDHVPDIAKVQIWCAFAEVVLGEASFAKPVK